MEKILEAMNQIMSKRKSKHLMRVIWLRKIYKHQIYSNMFRERKSLIDHTDTERKSLTFCHYYFQFFNAPFTTNPSSNLPPLPWNTFFNNFKNL